MSDKLFDTVRNLGLNKFTLMFHDAEVEADYSYDLLSNSRRLFRVSVISAFVSFSIFALLDFLYTTPSLLSETLMGVLLVGVLTALAVAFTYYESMLNYIRPVISLAIFFIGVSSVYFIVLDTGDYSYKNYLGLFLVFSYAFSFLKLGFFFAFIPSLVVYLAFVVVAFFKLDYSFEEMFIGSVFLSFALAVVSVASYINEVHLRNEFFLKRKLEKEQERVGLHNIELEAEVERRTVKLLRMNKALTRAKLRAQGNDQLKSAFLANISHEIRTPITKLVGFSQLMTNDNLHPEKRKKYSENIEEGANQILQIINDLIELSKIESHDILLTQNEFKLCVFLAELEEIAKTEIVALKKGGIVSFGLESEIDETLSVVADKVKLRQVLVNFIQNAVKFTECGSITLRCSERIDNYIEFCVEDTGIGIDEENFELVFDSFRQLDSFSNRHYGGNGVGLAINKGLISAMGGKVWLKSKKGRGSQFYCTIPRFV